LTLNFFGQDGRNFLGLNKENRIASQLFFYAFILHSNLRFDSVYGIKKPEPNDSGFLGSGDRNILHCISDGPKWEGLTRKSSDHFVIFLFAFPFAFEIMLSTLLRNILTLPTLTSFGRGKLTSFDRDGPWG
jgi:hypothetical protein